MSELDLTVPSLPSTDLPSLAAYSNAAGTFNLRFDAYFQSTIVSGDTSSVTVTEISPNPVPEASTTVSFGLLLALGIGVMAIKRRKTA